MTTSPRRVPLFALAGLLGAGSLLAACGDDDSPAAGDSTSTSRSPEDVQVPMSQVLEEIPAMLAAADEAAAAAAEGDFDAVLSSYDELHEIWEEIEGTIKTTDRDRYEAIEGAQSLIKDGGENEDAERVATGVADHEAAVDAFVADNS